MRVVVFSFLSPVPKRWRTLDALTNRLILYFRVENCTACIFRYIVSSMRNILTCLPCVGGTSEPSVSTHAYALLIIFFFFFFIYYYYYYYLIYIIIIIILFYYLIVLFVVFCYRRRRSQQEKKKKNKKKDFFVYQY